jgi:hypothetical protein
MLHLRVIYQKLGAGSAVTHYVVPCLINHGILNALFICSNHVILQVPKGLGCIESCFILNAIKKNGMRDYCSCTLELKILRLLSMISL